MPWHLDNRTDRRRAGLARALRRVLADATRPRPPIRGLAPLVRPAVAAACAPDLRRIVIALEDHTVEVGEAELARLHSLVTDGVTSPLYGHDAYAAAVAVPELCAHVVPAGATEGATADERTPALR